MKRLLAVLAACCMLLAASVTAQSLVCKFDPDDLIQLYPASAGDENKDGENKATQPNARRTHQPWATNVYETFYNPTAPKTQPNSYNTYMNWRDSLGEGEGISAFNIWLLDNPNARSWGEETVWDPFGPAPIGTADADGKWNVQTIANPWGAGWLVQWWTDDPANYINTISDIGEFSFCGTIYYDTDEDGYDASDPEVVAGDDVRIWFGALNWTDADGTQEWSLHFDDEGWGVRTPNDGGPWSAALVGAEGYGSGYEGVLDIEAIPEPATMLLLGFGLLGLAGQGIRRKKKDS
jgi:hypothetical protein